MSVFSKECGKLEYLKMEKAISEQEEISTYTN